MKVPPSPRRSGNPDEEKTESRIMRSPQQNSERPAGWPVSFATDYSCTPLEYKEEGKEPEVAYKGSFNVRFKKPENHRRAAIYAMTHNQSLNGFVEACVEKELNAINA